MFFRKMVLPSYGGVLEDVVYGRKPTVLPALRQETKNACATVLVTKVPHAVVCCTNKCLEAKGHHTEHLL